MQLISGATGNLPKDLYARVASYRHQVFVEQMGWPLHTKNGMESDQFDRQDTVYVVGQDAYGHITGCARLLPTTGPYLLREVFPQLLNGLPPPYSPEIWELSRFAAVDLHSRGAPYESTPTRMAHKLLEQSIACAAGHGAKKLITVTSIAVERLLSRNGFRSHRAGPPMIVDGKPIVACWIGL